MEMQMGCHRALYVVRQLTSLTLPDILKGKGCDKVVYTVCLMYLDVMLHDCMIACVTCISVHTA